MNDLLICIFLKLGIKKCLENFRQFFLDGQMSDLILKVGSREFNVHKMVLVARSPVFSSLFQHVLDEKNTDIIEIPDDINPESFEVFLHYLYFGNLEILSASNVCNVYYAADKYRVDDLKEKCVRFMKINLSIETICDIISLSIHHRESKLQKAAITFFNQNVKEIIKTKQWQKYLAENPTQANKLLNKDLNTEKA